MAEWNVPDAEKLSCSGAKRNVGTRKVVHRGLGEHGIVLKLRHAERRAVAGNQDELSCCMYAHPKQGRERGKREGCSSAQGTFSASRSSPRRERMRKGRTLAVAHLLEGRLVAEGVLARLDDEGKARRDGLGGLCCLGLLGGGHRGGGEGRRRRWS